MTIPPGAPSIDDGLTNGPISPRSGPSAPGSGPALTLLVTALAVARFIYEQEPSIEALAISLLLLTCAGGVLAHARARYSHAIRRASARGVRVPPWSLRLILFSVLLATVVLAFAPVVPPSGRRAGANPRPEIR